MSRIIGGTFEDVGETVVKPVTDEVGKAIEQGVQTVVYGPKQATSQQNQPKQPFDSAQGKLEEQKKLQAWRFRLEQLKKLEEAQKKVREEEKQKMLQRQQSFDSAQDKKKQIRQFEIVKKSQALHPAIAAKGKAEIKRGVGG